jgi:hypothetical protein
MDPDPASFCLTDISTDIFFILFPDLLSLCMPEVEQAHRSTDWLVTIWSMGFEKRRISNSDLIDPPSLEFSLNQLHQYRKKRFSPNEVSIRNGCIKNLKNSKIEENARKPRNNLVSFFEIKIKGLPSQPLFENLTPDGPIKDQVCVASGKIIPVLSRGFEDL